MSRLTVMGLRSLGIAAVSAAAIGAQEPTMAQTAPVPRQVLAARTAFIGNGGSETYGADSYFDLTKYDGGPNRPYDEFYHAVDDWGHYRLVGSTRDAEILLVIRFTNPVVNQQNAGYVGDLPHDLIRDPQLNLSINDPQTGSTLWSLTEHIDPSGGHADANRHFDEAIDRLVKDLERLTLTADPNLPAGVAGLPPGAIEARQRHLRMQHAGIGLLLGTIAGAAVGARSASDFCTPDPGSFTDCVSRSRSNMRNAFLTSIGAAVAGGLIGWFWPLNY